MTTNFNLRTNLIMRRGDLNHISGQVFASIVMLFSLAIGNVWAGGTHYVSATTADPAQGLVYLSTSNQSNVADSNFKNSQPGGLLVSTKDNNTSTTNACYITGNGSGCSMSNEFYWARPSRGYEFNGSWGTRGTTYPHQPASETGGCTQNDQANHGPWTGTADVIQSTAGGNQATWIRPTAYFKQATKYAVTYAVPEGGNYTVHYEYRKSYNTGTTESDGTAIWKFKTETEDYSLTPSTAEAIEVTSYAADSITLTVPNEATNFIGWYEGSTQKSTNKSYTYTAHDNVTVFPMFKELAWGDVTGDDVSVNVTATGTYGSKTVYVNCTKMIGSWADADFTVTPMNTSNEFGSVVINSVTADKTNSRVVITYTYTASNWGGIEAAITVTPPAGMGESKQFSIACSAEEVVDYEARIEVNDEIVEDGTGTLAAMMAMANGMTNKPTVKLMQNKTITAPLSFTKSMTFDTNGKVLTANCASAFSIDAAEVDVKIIDGSFTQVGEIHTSYASASTVSVVTFTKAAKLTMNGGTLSAENTGAGAAYGVDVRHGSEEVEKGSIFFMTGGDMTVTATTGNAQGVHVATASDYATLNGGSILVSAPTNAYGLWSAGQSNITDATVSVATTTGANAYGVYVNGGVSTITTTDFTVNAYTTDAYGAYVNNTGRLNFNGGKLAATADKDKAYGAYVASSGATAMLQMNAVVTASVTTGNGTVNVEVCGVHNLGTASLNNISVTATNNSGTATASTNYAAAVSTETGAVSTTIEDGTYTANAETGYAYAIRHRKGTLTVDGGTFKGILKTSGVGAFGAHVSDNATIANATLYGETKGSGSKAHGIVGNAGTVTLTNCDLTGKSNTNIAYAIYSRTNLTATGCTLTATTSGTDQAYGINAQAGTNVINNCNATVTAQTIYAYGAYHNDGALTINGGTYTVDAKQGAAGGAQNSELYGLYNAASKTTTVSNAIFTVIASNGAYSQNVYGAYINGTLISTGATYTAQAKINVYGVWGNTASTLTLSNNTISSTAANGATSYGVYAKKNFTIDGDIVSAQATTTGVYAMFFDATSVGEVRGGKFKATGNGTTTYGPLNATATAANVKLQGGVYDSNTNLDKYKFTGYNIYTIDDTEADYAAGYYYVIATQNPSPYVCKIVGGAHYTALEAALQYTKDNSGSNHVIVMTQNYTLPAGDYELPSNATLLIPHLVGQNAIYADGGGNDNKNKTTTSKDIVEFMRLTLAANAKLSVSGKIEVSAQMWCAETGHISYIKGPYARIYMNSGSLIQLNSGAVLYAWGKITGAGEIKVKGNAEVREMFQIYGMPNMSNLASSYNDNSYKYFPVQQYEINNIEVPTTYYRNARLVCAMSNYYKGSTVGVGYNKDDNINVVGTSGALFLVTGSDESSWVRKSYASSYQVWESNSSAQLGSLLIDMQQASMNSANYILPITTNMKIHILDGNFAITQDAQLLPGSQLEINKTGKLTINSGCKLYVFDADQSAFTSKPDAAVNVHGKIDVKGGFFTSKISGTEATDGANIYSNDADAGTITYSTNAASATSISLITSIGGSALSPTINTRSVSMEPAKLKNGNGSFSATSGTSSGEAWVYIDGIWQKTYTNGCFEVIGSTVYAKPSEYVALTNTAKDANDKWIGVAESNHTYAAEGGKILILMDECQWWEVVATSDPAVFQCEKEGYEGFYYYDTSTSKWKLKTVNVTFYMKETGTNASDKVIVTDYNGIPDQSVIASNPEKATTDAATYTFYGWKSSVSGTTYHWTATLETATADMSYRPVFTTNPRHYTITLVDANNGASVPLEIEYGGFPEYEPKKDPDAQYTYTFNGWSPEFTTVTGKKTYTAQWLSTINRYTVTWKNGDETIETDKNQAYGATPTYNGATPTKEPDNNFAYTFDGWSLTDGGAKVSPLPTVGGETTYYAHYSTTPRYKVTFANYDGTPLQQEFVTQGVNPIYNGLTPGRARDLDGYYKFIGWKNGAGTDYAPNATLPAVTAKETYTAQYDYVNELYLITLNNVDGNGASWSGKFGVGSTPFYNRDNNDVAVEPAKAGNAQYYYTFSGWSLTQNGAILNPVPAVSEEATYWAVFEQHTMSYDITFANLNGDGAYQTISVEYGTAPVCPVTPAKVNGCESYEWTGWNNGTYSASASLPAVTGNATYTASFSTTPTISQFDITFDLDNGTSPTVIPVQCGQTPSYSGTPTKPATAQYTYTFTGWYPTPYPVDGEESYIATYSQTVNSYTVRFVNYDGTELKSSVLTYGSTPTAPSTPSKPIDEANGKAYTFNGWSPAIGSVTGDVTYTATYSEMALVATVTTAGGVTTPYSTWASARDAAIGTSGNTLKLYSNVTQNNNSNIAVSRSLTIDLNGYTITGSSSSTSYTYLFNISNALTINDSRGGGKIKYTSSANRNCIAMNVSGSSASLTVNGGIIESEHTYGTSTNYHTAAVAAANSAKVYINGGELSANNKTARLAYVVNNNANNVTVTVTGGKFKVSSTNNSYMYIFNGNYLAKVTASGGYYSKDPGNITPATGYDKTTTTTGDPSGYTHKVVPVTYTIGYTLNSGSVAEANPTSYTIETATFTLNNPTRDHYTFAGWTGSNGNTPQTNVSIVEGSTGNKNYTANWTPVNYTIGYTLNGGSATNPESYNIETTTFSLNNPTKNGYTFTGWTGSNGSTPQTEVSIAKGSTGNKNYTANWTPTNYTISYELNGGSVTPTDANPTGYTIESAAITLINPTKQGYDFAGWTGTGLSSATTSVTIANGSTGNKTYTATWTPRNDTQYKVKHYKQKLDGTYNAEPDEIDNLTGTTATQVTPSRRSYTGFTAPAGQAVAILADGSQVVTYQYTRNSYELAWDANNGTLSGDYTSGSVKYDASITAPTVTRTGHTFTGWTPTFTGKMAAEDMTYVAQYELPQEIVAANGEQVEITSTATTITTIVEVGGTLKVETGNTLTTDHLILEASVDNSGEITGEGSVTVTPTTGTVNFDLTLNTWGRHWHSFGVPWQVDLDEHQLVEIKNKNGEPCNRPLVLDKDYDIVWYNGATRAANHGYVPACWEYIVDYTDERHAQLYPGKAYMIGFASAVGTVRFVKKTGAPIFYTEDVNVMENGYGGDDVHGGWNAIANPKVYHTLMSGMTGVEFAQVHKSDTIGADSYISCSLADHKFVVGTAVYVQAQETQSITINKAGSQSVISAPRRRVQSAQDNVVAHCEVEIAPEGGKMADRVYVQPEDDKADRYVAGKDVSKMGVSNRRAQMWIDRYNQKLCVNTVAPVNNKASYPLSIYAPADGDYTIYLNNHPTEDITLYLTYDGRAIWNLSYGGYVADLDKGTNSHYGLLIVRKAPELATGIEEITILNSDAVRKVMIEDKVFIIRNGEIYSVDGRLVK